MLTMKTKIGLFTIIPTALVAGYLYYPASLPACDSEAQVNLNLAKTFTQQVEQAGAKVKGFHIHNIIDHHDKETDVRFCASTVNLKVAQDNRELDMRYQTEFHIKWTDNTHHAYYIELLRLAPLNTEDRRQDDLNELTQSFKPVSFRSTDALPTLITAPTSSPQPFKDTQDGVSQEIIFFATTEDNHAFVTLFKEHNHTVFILGGEDGVNYRYVIPKLEATSTAGGSLYFADDGVGYKLMANKRGGMVLHIHDNSGYYQVVLNTTNEHYINRIPPVLKP